MRHKTKTKDNMTHITSRPRVDAQTKLLPSAIQFPDLCILQPLTARCILYTAFHQPRGNFSRERDGSLRWG